MARAARVLLGEARRAAASGAGRVFEYSGGSAHWPRRPLILPGHECTIVFASDIGWPEMAPPEPEEVCVDAEGGKDELKPLPPPGGRKGKAALGRTAQRTAAAPASTPTKPKGERKDKGKEQEKEEEEEAFCGARCVQKCNGLRCAARKDGRSARREGTR